MDKTRNKRQKSACAEWSPNDIFQGLPLKEGWSSLSAEWFKHYIILFGGFSDTSQQTRYFNDLWIYDCLNFVWHNPVLPTAAQKPDARSSFSFHPDDHGAVLFGGYSRVKSSNPSGKQGKQGAKTVAKPLVHEDTWFLRITPPSSEVASTIPLVRWERRKKPANLPTPPRAGVTQTFHKGRGIMFAGVHDVEESEEGIESQFFDDLYAWNIGRNRFYQLTLRRPRAAIKKQTEDLQKKHRSRVEASEVELLRNLAALEQTTSVSEVEGVDMERSEDEEKALKVQKIILNCMPHRRYNAHLAVQRDVLYIFGGTFEHGDREYTLDEMHAIDLGKLDGVEEIYKREPENWQGEDEASDSDSEEESESEDEEMQGDVPAGVLLPNDEDFVKPVIAVEPEQLKMEDEEEQAGSASIDNRPFPRPFENLKDYFFRTSTTWQNLVLEKLRRASEVGNTSVKETRKLAFELAEEKWWDSREEISAEEERQEEAGIGEVVSLADRSKEAGSIGRRR